MTKSVNLHFSPSREESRMSSLVPSNLLGSGPHTDGCTDYSEVPPSEVEEGVKETIILSGFREEDLDDCSLVETLNTLVPLIHDAGAPAPLITFQGGPG
jgi:hypothetical protein